MPRKKVEPTTDLFTETTPETPAVTEEKPKRARKNPLKKLAETLAASVGLIEAPEPTEEPKPATKGRAKPKVDPIAEAPAPQAEATPEPAEEAAAPEETKGRRDRNRRKTRAKDTPQVEPESFVAQPALSEEEIAQINAQVISGIDDLNLPLPEWRPRTAAAKPNNGNNQSRRQEQRNKKDRPKRERPERPAQEEEAQVVEPIVLMVPEKLPARKPPKPPKPLIPTPHEAPRVVVRDGVPTLVRNKKVYVPLFFLGNPADEKRASNVLAQVKLASEAGVLLYNYVLDLVVDERQVEHATSFAAYLLAKTVEIDPGAQVMFRVNFVPGKNWESEFPDAVFNTSSGHIAEPSICDDQFWEVAQSCLRHFVEKLYTLPYEANILGVQLDRGEWFYSASHGYDTSRAATEKFRDWAAARYLDDKVALRASWFNGEIDFDDIEIPRYQPAGQNNDRFIRSSRKQRPWVDYHLFLSDETSARISELAYAVKEASAGRMLVAVSYGYTFEWSHPASGHLSLGKLLRTPEVDIISGPPSYSHREPGETAPMPGPIDSFALNGKLFISEEDFKTSIGGQKDSPDDYNPMIKTPQALESVHWRGIGAAVASSSGVNWMDLWGNGWLNTPAIWSRAKQVSDNFVRRMAAPPVNPDVIVFIDERALAYLVDPAAFRLLVHNVRDSVLRSGLSAGFYLLSDLAHREQFPEAKLYLFLNAWDIRPDLRSAIKQRLQRDNKLLFWLYAANLFDSGREALERAREVTGIALKPQPFGSKAGTTILNRRHPLCEVLADRQLAAEAKPEPTYFAIPEEATVLGEYSQTGLPSFVIKEFKEGKPEEHWQSVFLGEPMVTPGLIRALGAAAGAHVWNYQDDVVHVRSPFVSIHCKGTGPRSLALPPKTVAYNVQKGEWITDSLSVKFNAIDGSTHTFLVGPKQEIEHLLSVDPSTVLHMEELPKEPEQQERPNTFQFDVPIMKLDEWMEGSEDSLSVDEWLLRPKLEDVEAMIGVSEDEPGQIGSRRRKRGRNNRSKPGRGSNGSDAPGTVFNDSGDDVTLNVVFRTRD